MPEFTGAELTEVFVYVMVGLIGLCILYEIFLGKK
jgi:hypothetical protein